MLRKLKWVFVLYLLGMSAQGGTVMATQGSMITSSTVSRGRFDEIDVQTGNGQAHQASIKTTGSSDLYVISNTIPPGGHSGWHTHPGPSLITVQAGTVTAYDGDDPTCTPQVYQAGSGFIDPGDGHVHLLRNEGSVDAVTIAVQILPADAERRIDAPAPSYCPF
ncbi:MAG TPA: cupin domain-containing protein [Chloroflexota bacterium]|jgi:quercetin dioxygenase-like cupin family protein